MMTSPPHHYHLTTKIVMDQVLNHYFSPLATFVAANSPIIQQVVGCDKADPLKHNLSQNQVATVVSCYQVNGSDGNDIVNVTFLLVNTLHSPGMVQYDKYCEMSACVYMLLFCELCMCVNCLFSVKRKFIIAVPK